MVRKSLFFLLLWCIGIGLFAQNESDTHSKRTNAQGTMESNKDDNIKDKGFEFSIGGGCYFGSKYNAQYYNGSLENENNLAYIFGNKYRYDEINNYYKEYYPYISDSVSCGGPLGNTSYKAAVMISLGVKYRFTKNWGIQLNFSFARLKARGQFRVLYSSVPGTYRTGCIDNQYILGKEDRSMFDLAATYVFTTKSIVKPFFEIGAQFNYIRVKAMDAIFYDENNNAQLTYSLLNTHQDYVPGVQSDGTVYKYGGAGFGFSTVVGIKIKFNQFISLDPCFYFSASRFGLVGYPNFSFNYGIMIRITMSDQIN